ncbi:MAG: sigma-54-dependent transcriptional regulator, partial [Myxococcota bacterium]
MNYTRDTTSGREGLALLDQLQVLVPTLPIIVMTAWGSVGGAVEALRRGARDYIEKPWDNARLMSVLRTQIELGRALRRAQRLETENRLLRSDGLPRIIAESPRMRPVLQLMEKVGPSDANVLISGEHGTGKELVAQWLHAVSSRGPKSFIAVNMGGLSEGLFESELFGHVRGAFTDAKTAKPGLFEAAEGGSLFLDEIDRLALELQSKLLRTLEQKTTRRLGATASRRFDVRLIAATNADLGAEVRAGRFREDLFYRLNVVSLQLPPLRARGEDVIRLAEFFLRKFSVQYGLPEPPLPVAVRGALLAHPWPGNVRELRNAVERALLLSAPGTLDLAEVEGGGTLLSTVETLPFP